MAEFLKQELIWTRKPERVFMDETKVEIITECSTDGVPPLNACLFIRQNDILMTYKSF